MIKVTKKDSLKIFAILNRIYIYFIKIGINRNLNRTEFVICIDFFSFYRKLASANKEITEPLLCELANTEEANRTGKMTVSHFIYSLFK